MVVTGIASRGMRIRKTAFNEPSMDEVFLEVTGKSMRDAQEETPGHKGQEREGGGKK